MNKNNGVKIYTIGHSNNNLEHLSKLLNENNVKILLDVRSHPYSKFVPQFNRENLERESRQLGFDYRFAGDYLGGKPTDKSCYNGDKVDYDKIASKDYYKKAIERLIEIGKETVTAILCSEENPHACHRHNLVAQTLLDIRCGGVTYQTQRSSRKSWQTAKLNNSGVEQNGKFI